MCLPEAVSKTLRQMAFPALAALFAVLPFLRCVGYPFLELWDDASIYYYEESLSLSLASLRHWLDCWFNMLPLLWLGGSPFPGDPWRELVPMVTLTHMLDYAIAGFNPWIYHLQSVLWHGVCAAGLYKCFTLFRVRPWLALAFVAVFAVHPQRVESVVWVSERRDVVYGAFAVWSFYLYAKGRGASLFSSGAFLLFILSLASKPMATAMPLVLFGFELLEQRAFSLKETARRLWPYFLASFLVAAEYNSPHVDSLGSVSFPMKLFIAAHNLVWYPLKALLPLDLCPIYPSVEFSSPEIVFTVSGLLAALVILGLIALRSREFLLRRALPFALMAAFSLSTVIGFFQINAVNYADRYSYVFSTFVCFALAWLLSRALDWAEAGGRLPVAVKALPVLLCVWIASLGVSTWFHEEVYKSSLALFAEASLYKPPNPYSILMLANAEREAGIPNAADLYAKRLLSSGLEKEIPPPGTKGVRFRQEAFWYFKGLELAQGGRPKEALEILLKVKYGILGSKAFWKNYSSPLLMCIAQCQLGLGRRQEAISTMDELIQSYEGGPESPDALCSKGVRSVYAGDLDAAEGFFLRALQARPKSEGFKANLERVRGMKASAKPSLTEH